MTTVVVDSNDINSAPFMFFSSSKKGYVAIGIYGQIKNRYIHPYLLSRFCWQ